MRLIAYILSQVYALVVTIRNFLYDNGIFKQWTPPVKTICVGNLAVGGTGKTPHSIYLIQSLQNECSVAFLSRGYKRRKHGYIELNTTHQSSEVGDEPLLVKRRFPHLPVAVCEKRKMGIEKLVEHYPNLHCIILDDAMQHRAVRPGKTLLLTPYDQLYVNDTYLPHGRLRDSVNAAKRADWIIVTKCPPQITSEEQQQIKNALAILPHQHLFFSSISYSLPRQLQSDQQREWNTISEACLITGIANPHHLEAYVQSHIQHLQTLRFADHHNFNSRDIHRIEQLLSTMPQDTLLLTTEKDAMRLLHMNEITDSLRSRIYYIPIEIKIINEQEIFTKILNDYVREN